MFAGNEWPSGSYGLPRPKSGCPGGKKNGWREGWRYQDMEDSDKSTSERSRVSIGSHMRVTLVGNKKDVNKTFCTKQNTGIDARIWPKGKVLLYMHILTTMQWRSQDFWPRGAQKIRGGTSNKMKTEKKETKYVHIGAPN
jgi:hypothetical protein